MALFSLTDISFGKSNDPITGPLSALYKSQYATSTFRYPSDVGAFDKGHYMLFHINTQSKTSFDGIDMNITAANAQAYGDLLSHLKSSLPKSTVTETSSDLGKAIDGIKSFASNAVSGIQSIATSAGNAYRDATKKLGLDKLGIAPPLPMNLPFVGPTNGGERFNQSPLRTTKRTNTSIALYMPDTLVFDYSHGYDEPSMTTAAGLAGGLLAAKESLADKMKANGGKINVKDLKNMSPLMAEAAAAILGANNPDRAKLIMGSVGVVKNPQLEVLYSSTALRKFNFEFMFYPRSQQEAVQVQQIIESFRFHAAPEVESQNAGRYLVPPSEFDIEFMMNGAPNPNIPRITTCVLENISIDFAPNGWTAYEVPGRVYPSVGGTGTPTATRMTLSFRETQMITKEMIRKNGKDYARNQLDSLGFGSANKNNEGGH